MRRGLGRAVELNAHVVGYVDADMATPADEVGRLLDVLRESDLAVVMGSRLAILGHVIERSPLRHYLGRVFATGASMVLGVAVYDTQCGAKFFRVTDGLRAALAEPFASRWAFDVELLGRLIRTLDNPPHGAASPIREVPLRRWHDTGRSKVRPMAMVLAFLSLALIRRRLAAWRPGTPV